MTVKELLTLTDSVKKNDLCDEIKMRWINDVEGRIKCEIFKIPPKDVKCIVGEDEILSAPDPYSRLYLLYLVSMIAFSKGDYSEYSASALEFEKAFVSYAKHCIRSR